jgi:hypothetical protein
VQWVRAGAAGSSTASGLCARQPMHTHTHTHTGTCQPHLRADKGLHHDADGHVDVHSAHAVAQVHLGVCLAHADHGLEVAHSDGQAARAVRLLAQLRVHLLQAAKLVLWWPAGVRVALARVGVRRRRSRATCCLPQLLQTHRPPRPLPAPPPPKHTQRHTHTHRHRQTAHRAHHRPDLLLGVRDVLAQQVLRQDVRVGRRRQRLLCVGGSLAARVMLRARRSVGVRGRAHARA